MLGDCMDLLAELPDKSIDLAIVDPPYGLERFKNGIGKNDRHTVKTTNESWNNDIPNYLYFNELFRISNNQIIWGANNFTLPPTEYFCIWNKKQTVDNFASAEYAWTNCNMPAKVFRYAIHKEMATRKDNGGKIHPTQKPVALYKWLLTNYAKPNDKILDTHLGSGSSRIAADKANLPFMGCELDSDYFYASVNRFKEYSAQQTMF